MNQGHVQSGEVINLELLKGDMDVDASYALIKTEDMEVIRMALPEGKEINQHSVEGEMSVQCLTGHIQFKVEDTLQNLTPDDWMFIERNKLFSYTVKEDTIVLATILFNDEPGKAL
jgi:quercetin dioxygenase-like cupin family protein